MIRSYRIFMGRSMEKRLAAFMGTCFAITAALGIIVKAVDSDVANGFVKNFLPVFMVIIAPSLCAGTIINVYSANWKNMTTGYKFYHSLPDAAGRFRKAIITANIVAAAVILCYSLLFIVLFTFKLAIFSIALSLLIIGIINFLGHLRSVWGMLVPLMMLGFFAGLFSGINYNDIPDTAVVIAVTAIVVLFIGSTAFAAAVAGSAWEKEREKCKD